MFGYDCVAKAFIKRGVNREVPLFKTFWPQLCW